LRDMLAQKILRTMPLFCGYTESFVKW
jgi:hypothetical protein